MLQTYIKYGKEIANLSEKIQYHDFSLQNIIYYLCGFNLIIHE